MKKIISFIALCSLMIVSVISIASIPNKVQGQNIGSLQSIVNSGFSFKKDLQLGDTDPDVAQLQRVLNADIDTMVATDGPGAPGFESTYFGALTKNAVIKFQMKYSNVILAPVGLTAGNGLVNKLTRTKLNLLLGVFNTYDSVGVPQNRAGSGSAASNYTYTPAVYTPPASSQQSLSVCSFVELLISIGAVDINNMSRSRSVFGCSSPTTYYGTNQNYNNGYNNGSYYIPAQNNYSNNNTNNNNSNNNSSSLPVINSYFPFPQATSTKIYIYANKTVTAVVKYGINTGSINIVNATAGVATSTISTYSNSVSGTAASSSHIITINNLVPSTVYHYSVMVTDSSGNIAVTTDQIFNTISSSAAASSTNSIASSSSADLTGSSGGAPAPIVNVVGAVLAFEPCYTNGVMSGRMNAVVIAPCAGRDVFGASVSTPAAPYKFVRDSHDGQPTPVVGQFIAGSANSGAGKVANVSKTCPQNTPTGAPGSPDISGYNWVGYILNYQQAVDNGTCKATLTGGGTSGNGSSDGSLTGGFPNYTIPSGGSTVFRNDPSCGSHNFTLTPPNPQGVVGQYQYCTSSGSACECKVYLKSTTPAAGDYTATGGFSFFAGSINNVGAPKLNPAGDTMVCDGYNGTIIAPTSKTLYQGQLKYCEMKSFGSSHWCSCKIYTKVNVGTIW